MVIWASVVSCKVSVLCCGSEGAFCWQWMGGVVLVSGDNNRQVFVRCWRTCSLQNKRNVLICFVGGNVHEQWPFFVRCWRTCSLQNKKQGFDILCGWGFSLFPIEEAPNGWLSM